MRKIDMVASWIRSKVGFDGVLHILGSLILCKVFDIILPLWISIILTLVIGIAKEFYDSKTGSFIDKKDLYCDLIGIVLYLFIIL